MVNIPIDMLKKYLLASDMAKERFCKAQYLEQKNEQNARILLVQCGLC